MAVAPEHYRAARLALPRLPLPAILGFALFGVTGSVFLVFSSFSLDEVKYLAAASNDSHVYEAKAVPFESQGEDPAQRAASIGRALTATQAEVSHTQTAEAEQPASVSNPVVLSDSDRELRGFNRFANFGGANSYLAMTGATFGISAQTAPAGFAAPDAETYTMAPVPEASTWMCGGALFVLVAARGAHARWQRKRRRAGD